MTERACVLGIDIGGTNLRVALADKSGKILARTSSTTTNVRDAHVVVAKICECTDQLLQEVGLARKAIGAIGAGAPGVTNAETGVVIATSYLMGWRDVPLKPMLEEAIGAPAAVDNDVNLAALGESFFGAARGAPNFVFLAIGSGVGAGIILKDELFQGTAWTAGEIGYMLVPGVSESPAAPGQPGPLESLVGGESLRMKWMSLWDSTQTKLPQHLTATQIFDGAVAGDVVANSLLDRAAYTLACAIFNMTLILNPPLFILGGSVGLHAELRDRTQKVVDTHARRLCPRVVLSSLGSDAQIMGAIRLAQLTAQR
jgi:predicted NBD/HSP70 family sugar kinase